MFPDKNIEAALIAMDDLDEMQAKAKQLVQIYKPCLMKMKPPQLECVLCTLIQLQSRHRQKAKKKEKVSNQHELAP